MDGSLNPPPDLVGTDEGVAVVKVIVRVLLGDGSTVVSTLGRLVAIEVALGEAVEAAELDKVDGLGELGFW